ARRSTAPRRILAGWNLTAWAQVALPGLYWQHYYLLPIAGTAISVAILLADAASVVAGVGGRGKDGSAGEISRLKRASTKIGTRLCGTVGAALTVIVLSAAIIATFFLQAREYLLVPAQEIGVRYKGGRQWVVLRDMGRDLARRAAIWDS